MLTPALSASSSCDREKLSAIQRMGSKHGVGVEVIGETLADTLEIGLDGKRAISANVSDLRDAYENSLEKTLKTDAELVVT